MAVICSKTASFGKSKIQISHNVTFLKTSTSFTLLKMSWAKRFFSSEMMIKCRCCLFWSSSCSECSGLLTVLLRCSSEMNLKRRSPFSSIPFSFCISTSYRYILACDWTSWNCGPFHGQWPWSMGEKSQTMEPGFFKKVFISFFFLFFFNSIKFRQLGCWGYISMYIVFVPDSWSIKCTWFYSLKFCMQTSRSPVQYSPLVLLLPVDHEAGRSDAVVC